LYNTEARQMDIGQQFSMGHRTKKLNANALYISNRGHSIRRIGHKSNRCFTRPYKGRTLSNA
jgi:hypothetical protein